jgi:hypothetical protein
MSLFSKNRNPDGTFDGIGVMASMTGLSRKSIEEIAAEVKENHARLKSCTDHQFDAPLDPRQRKRVCRNCKGEADSASVIWYEEGKRHVLQALQGSGNDRS